MAEVTWDMRIVSKSKHWNVQENRRQDFSSFYLPTKLNWTFDIKTNAWIEVTDYSFIVARLWKIENLINWFFLVFPSSFPSPRDCTCLSVWFSFVALFDFISCGKTQISPFKANVRVWRWANIKDEMNTWETFNFIYSKIDLWVFAQRPPRVCVCVCSNIDSTIQFRCQSQQSKWCINFFISYLSISPSTKYFLVKTKMTSIKRRQSEKRIGKKCDKRYETQSYVLNFIAYDSILFLLEQRQVRKNRNIIFDHESWFMIHRYTWKKVYKINFIVEHWCVLAATTKKNKNAIIDFCATENLFFRIQRIFTSQCVVYEQQINEINIVFRSDKVLIE